MVAHTQQWQQQSPQHRRKPGKFSSPTGGKDEIALAQTLRGVATPSRTRTERRPGLQAAHQEDPANWADVPIQGPPAAVSAPVSLESALPAPLPPQQPWQNQSQGTFQPSGYRETLRAKGDRFFRHCPSWSHFLAEADSGYGMDPSLMMGAGGGSPLGLHSPMNLQCQQWAAEMLQMQQAMMPPQMMLSDALLSEALNPMPALPLPPLNVAAQLQEHPHLQPVLPPGPQDPSDLASLLLGIAMPGGACLKPSEIEEQLKAAAPCQYED